MKTILDLAIRSSDDAFEEYAQIEVARILREVADSIADSTRYCGGNLYDINGARCGSFEFRVDGEKE